MPQAKYPEHDINQVFDYIHTILSSGNVAENALDEMSFLNRLFAALPVEAVEYGMQFLHGKRDLPKAWLRKSRRLLRGDRYPRADLRKPYSRRAQ